MMLRGMRPCVVRRRRVNARLCSRHRLVLGFLPAYNAALRSMLAGMAASRAARHYASLRLTSLYLNATYWRLCARPRTTAPRHRATPPRHATAPPATAFLGPAPPSPLGDFERERPPPQEDFGNGDILPQTYPVVAAVLADVPGAPHRPEIAVVTGFLARAQKSGAIATLGRGGSDLTATVLGRALGVREVQVPPR